MNINDEDSPLSMKADFLLSLCELIVGGKEGLQPIEKTVIDRCVRLVYREMALGLEPAKTPLLQDLYEELLRQPEPEARRVATALELYCTGSLNLFNHPTNVDLNSRVVCIVLKGLGENLRKIAMHTTNEFVTAAVNANHAEGVATWCYFDEFHILLRDPLTASYFVAVWKMLRKKGCVPSALTQNVKTCWPAGRSKTFWTTRISWCCCRRRRATVRSWQSSSVFPSISSPTSRTPIPARACCSMEMSPSRL